MRGGMHTGLFRQISHDSPRQLGTHGRGPGPDIQDATRGGNVLRDSQLSQPVIEQARFE
jgi:hypothetical protein